jgi:hypothetical protein
MKEIFEKIIILGRPASGKSEILDYLKRTHNEERKERFHIGKMVELDDFPMLWTWFEEDAILEKIMNKSRIHTTPDGYFLHDYMWHLLIERISLDYTKSLRDDDGNITRLIEFSRGSEHGGYKEAFKHLSEELLKNSSLLYVNIPYEESLRKNRKRFNPDRPDSILEHGLPDEKLERLYKEVDWEDVSAGSNTKININGIYIPFVVFENMPSKTDDDELLGPALDDVFSRLWNLYNE